MKLIRIFLFCIIFLFCWSFLEPEVWTAPRKGWYGEDLPYNLELLTGEWTAGPCPRPPRPQDQQRVVYNEAEKLYICSKDRSIMVYVPPGEFIQGSSRSENNDSKNERRVKLSGYYIDRYEVTNSQYIRFVQKDYGLERYWSPEGLFWLRENVNRKIRKKILGVHPGDIFKPAVEVCWYEAEAYASAQDKKLPTEAQWEKAARGPNGNTYPWGNIKNFPEYCRWSTDPEDHKLFDLTDFVQANKMMKEKKFILKKNQQHEEERTNLSIVGTYPQGASPYGCQDMIGNVWEWVRDYYSLDYYSRAPSQDPYNGEPSALQITRGGSWKAPENFMSTFARVPRGPYKSEEDVGFRCVIEAPVSFSIEAE